MKKKLIFSIVFSTLFLIGAILLIYKSHTYTHEPHKDFWVVQSTGSAYPFRLTFLKTEHVTYGHIAHMLNPHSGIPSKITLSLGKGGNRVVDPKAFINSDCKLKIKY